jgi:autoinducer 2-degrading protein
MYVVCVTIQVTPGREAEFVEATLKNAAGARVEPGCARFDVLQAADGTPRFFLYEVYGSEADFAAHQKTPHYLEWKERVAPMMAEPRVGVRHVSVSPDPWV